MRETKRFFVVSFAILVALAMLAIPVGVAHAAPSMPEAVPFQQADGTYILVQARGDEFFNWHECDQGYIIQFDVETENWYYAVGITQDGVAIAGHQLVGQPDWASELEHIMGFRNRLAPQRMVAEDPDFVAIAETVARQNKIELGQCEDCCAVNFEAAVMALNSNLLGEEGSSLPAHNPTWADKSVTRPHQPMLMFVAEWENVHNNPLLAPEGWDVGEDGPYRNQTGAWSYAHMFEGNVNAFWATRLFGTEEMYGGADMRAQGFTPEMVTNPIYNVKRITGPTPAGHGFNRKTVNEWLLEASGPSDFQFVRMDGMGLDGVWDGRSSVNYFIPEVTNAIRTNGYFYANRATLQSLGVNNISYLRIEHGVVRFRFTTGHPGYNIGASPGLGPSVDGAFNAIRHFINWDVVPRRGGTGANANDVLAQDFNIYFVYGGYEGALGGNAAKPSFWAHAMLNWMPTTHPGVTPAGIVSRDPIPGVCEGIDMGRRLRSVSFPAAGGLPTRNSYGSHGEQSHTGIAQGLGVFIHELGHSVWGLPDIAVGGGMPAGELCVGFWCAMGRGTWGAFRYRDYNVNLGTGATHFRAPMAYEIGWVTPKEVTSMDNIGFYIGNWSDPRTVWHWDPEVHCVEEGDMPIAVKVTNTSAMYELFPGIETPNTAHDRHQFFMVENFQHVGLDRSASLQVQNRGIMIWHVDTRTNALQSASGGVTASNNSHRRHNVVGVMVADYGVPGSRIHSGWYADPFFLPGETFGPCEVPGHAERGWCDPTCPIRFDNGVHRPITNFHAPHNMPTPWADDPGDRVPAATFPAAAAGVAGGVHAANHPRVVPTDIHINVVGPGGSGRTGHIPTRDNPTSFAPWIVQPRIWVDFGQQTSTPGLMIAPVNPAGNAITFPERDFGYTDLPEARTFRVANRTIHPMTDLSVSLLSHGPGRGPGYASDVRAFTLSSTAPGVTLNTTPGAEATISANIASLAPGAFVDITIQPVLGLDTAVDFCLDLHGRGGLATDNPGVGGFHGARVDSPHRADVVVSGRGGLRNSFEVSFMVNPLPEVRFTDLVYEGPNAFNNAVGPRTVQFYVGENWPALRTNDAVPFLEWEDTGMPKTWVPLVGTFVCGEVPTVTETFMMPGNTSRTSVTTLSRPFMKPCCEVVGGCGEEFTLGSLPTAATGTFGGATEARGLAIFPANHFFGGHLWGRPTLAGTFEMAFYLRHKSDDAHAQFGGDIGFFEIIVTEGELFSPYFALHTDGHTINWYRTRTAHNLHGANNAAGNAALASGAYRILINGEPHMVVNPEDPEGDKIPLELPPGEANPLVARTFNLRDLGLVGEPGEVFAFNMVAVVREDLTDHWRDSPPNRESLFLTAPIITTTSLPAAPEGAGVAYGPVTLTATSETPVIWSLTPGYELPDGLVLSPEGVISGTPTVEGVFTLRFRATNAVSSDSNTLTLVIGEEPTPMVLSFDIFNNGPGGSPSRPNANLNPFIRMWTQINGVNTPVLYADLTVTAVLPNGEDAMRFVRLNRPWVAQETVNFIDVNKNGPWDRIYLTATLNGSTVTVILVNDYYVPTILSLDIFNNGVNGSPSRPNPGLAAAGTIRMWTQINGVNTPVPFADLVVTARLPNGNCAMEFVTVHRPWVNQATVNFIDVNRNRPWERIYLTIELNGKTATVTLSNL